MMSFHFYITSYAKFTIAVNCLTRFIIALLLVTTSAQAQPYYFRHYQVENGLSNNTVFCSLQDDKGFMWFGTKDGLNRFDGYRFKLFNIIEDNESTLSQDAIITMAMDRHSQLWVGSQKGLYKFDATKERLVPFIDSLHDVADILFDKKGQLWFTSSLDVYQYNFETNRLQRILPSSRFLVTAMCEADDGNIWFSSDDGHVQYIDEKTGKLNSYSVFSKSPQTSSFWIEKIQQGPKGNLYVGTTNQGIKQFDLSTKTYKDVLPFNEEKNSIYVRDILKVSEDEYWFATELGVFIINPSINKVTNLTKKYLDPYTLTDNAAYSVYKDKEDGIWVGTYFGGVNYYSKQHAVFQKYFPDNNNNNSISGNAVREICEDNNGNIWIGTEDAGLNRLNPSTGAITRFLPT